MRDRVLCATALGDVCHAMTGPRDVPADAHAKRQGVAQARTRARGAIPLVPDNGLQKGVTLLYSAASGERSGKSRADPGLQMVIGAGWLPALNALIFHQEEFNISYSTLNVTLKF